MRIVGLDLGDRRIGVAAAEEETRVAIPVATLTVAGDAVDAIVQLVQDQRADELVIGLPLSMSGAIGSQAQHVMSVVQQLGLRLSIPVRTWDERLTTVQAGRSMGSPQKRGRSRGGAAGPGRDAVAAAILLQAYLDGRRAS
jgi:putative Holliday junction resolvase